MPPVKQNNWRAELKPDERKELIPLEREIARRWKELKELRRRRFRIQNTATRRVTGKKVDG